MNARAPISSGIVFLLALTTGFAVSSIYLIQPLGDALARALEASNEKIGALMTLTQVGYGLGILFLVPLGDVLRKKRLIFTKLLVLAGALALTGFAGGYLGLLLGSVVIGLAATTAQDAIPLAADLSPEASRGAVVGKVMSGLLLGILVSRTASGAIAEALGWRWVFWLFAAATLGIALLIQARVPDVPAKSGRSYGSLLRSLGTHFSAHPALRNALITQGLLGMGLSAFWSNLSFYLSAEPFHMSSGRIGLFGLAGAAGALVAPFAGRISDRRGPAFGIVGGCLLCVGSFALILALPASLWALIVATAVFDLGVQMALISHQSVVYALDPSARASLNAVFVASVFASFSFGSAVSVSLLGRFGWSGVVSFCLITATLALANSLRARPRSARAALALLLTSACLLAGYGYFKMNPQDGFAAGMFSFGLLGIMLSVLRASREKDSVE